MDRASAITAVPGSHACRMFRRAAAGALLLGLSGCLATGDALSLAGVHIPGINPSFARTPGGGVDYSERDWRLVETFTDDRNIEGALLMSRSPRHLGVVVDGMMRPIPFATLRTVSATQMVPLSPGNAAYIVKSTGEDRIDGRRVTCEDLYLVIGISPTRVRSWGMTGCNVPFAFTRSADGNHLILTAMEAGGDAYFRLDPTTMTMSERFLSLPAADYAAVYGAPVPAAPSATPAAVPVASPAAPPAARPTATPPAAMPEPRLERIGNRAPERVEAGDNAESSSIKLD
jgi:hypothetical protein